MEPYSRTANISGNKSWSSHHLHQLPLQPDPSNQPAGSKPQMSRNHPELRPRYHTQSTPVEDVNLQILSADGEDGVPAASDFVRKLFRMLEDPAFASIVCWGSQRDCFIVKDMTEFTKVILPRLFKHSNFASFVRQLNKYDFHKVKNTDDNAHGEHCWTFRHPKFRADHLDGLEDIKRKSAPTRRATTRHAQASPSKSPDSPVNRDGLSDSLALQSQIDQLLQAQHEMKAHIVTLETNYRSVLDEMASFQRSMASQDALLKTLLQQVVDFEQQKPADAFVGKLQPSLDSNFVSAEAQRMMSTSAYNSDDVARASLQQLTELSRRAIRSVPVDPVPPPPSQFNPTVAQAPAVGSLENLPRLQTSPDVDLNPSTQFGSPPLPIPTQSPLDWSRHNGLQVLTVGHLLPRSSEAQSSDDMELEEQVMPSTGYPNPPSPPSTRLRVRRKTYVPGWSVPPRVLLVEDDAVSRRLSSKFLQVLGVTADIAIDGDAAVKQMCLERYDLVLMDIVMPRLDGVAATSLIRQFDDRTPIISMTSNSCPQDILNYYSHGMNDILPKPFTRDGLFSMLEKHLIHLKAMSQMQQIPRGLPGGDIDRLKEVNDNQTFKPEDQGSSFMPPGSSTPFSVSTFIPGTPGLGFINPIAGLGVADEQQYASMLATMTGDLFSDPSTRIGVKRSAQDDPDTEDHPSKRSRFETVE